MSFVEVNNLAVHYGKFVAVKRLNLSIPKGEVFGFIGPNGAGKSSTMKVLATLLKPTMGTASIGGVDVVQNPNQIRSMIGYVPDFFGVYEDLTVKEYLHFFAAAYDLRGSERERTIKEVLELTDLSYKITDPVDGLSRGMKQRLSLARVLLHDPDLLLLDEPASGLDPRARIDIRELLKELRNMGKTIIISSHILQELAQLCTQIGIIELGEMVAEGSLDDIYKQLSINSEIHVQASNFNEQHEAAIKALEGVMDVESHTDRVSVKIRPDQMSVEDFHQHLVQMGLRIRMFQPEAIDMETAFMKLTQGITQ